MESIKLQFLFGKEDNVRAWVGFVVFRILDHRWMDIGRSVDIDR